MGYIDYTLTYEERKHVIKETKTKKIKHVHNDTKSQ